MTRGLVGVNEFFVYRDIDDGDGQFIGGLGGFLVVGVDRFDYGLDSGTQL